MRKRSLPIYANYFVKYLKANAAEGVRVLERVGIVDPAHRYVRAAIDKPVTNFSELLSRRSRGVTVIEGRAMS